MCVREMALIVSTLLISMQHPNETKTNITN